MLDGADALKSACAQLPGALKQLRDGAGDMHAGLSDASGGVSEMIRVIDEMIDGVSQLDDGVKELNDDGLKEMKNTLDGLDGYLNTLAGKADAYGSFMDVRNAAVSTVQFVLKTDGIYLDSDETAQVSAAAPEKKGFWEKLKSLFGEQ